MNSSFVPDRDTFGKWSESACATQKPGGHWSIILAGGNGTRIGDLTNRWMGRPVAKQYCAFVGTRSMLQHTLCRADKVGQRENQLTVIAYSHQREAQAQLADWWSRGVIVQPANRDTFAGIFLPLTYVYAQDPKATVAIYPSDHFIYPEKNFVHVMKHAVEAVEDQPYRLVLIGAPADCLELEYGWICPGPEIWRSGKYTVRSVKHFLEKPSRANAMAARACGGLWNTLIMAVKASTLWKLGWIYAPEILERFERLCAVIGTSRESSVLESVYRTMPVKNFSTDLLVRAATQVGVMPMESVLWNDWGRAERILETLRLIGKEPNFPMALLAR
jgi:mannose-1-phosphate guanylyltransferase